MSLQRKPVPRWKRLANNRYNSRKGIAEKTGRYPHNGRLTPEYKKRIIEVGCWTRPPKGWRWAYSIPELAKIFEVSEGLIRALLATPRRERRIENAAFIVAEYYAGNSKLSLQRKYQITHATLTKLIDKAVGIHKNMRVHDDDEVL